MGEKREKEDNKNGAIVAKTSQIFLSRAVIIFSNVKQDGFRPKFWSQIRRAFPQLLNMLFRTAFPMNLSPLNASFHRAMRRARVKKQGESEEKWQHNDDDSWWHKIFANWNFKMNLQPKFRMKENIILEIRNPQMLHLLRLIFLLKCWYLPRSCRSRSQITRVAKLLEQLEETFSWLGLLDHTDTKLALMRAFRPSLPLRNCNPLCRQKKFQKCLLPTPRWTRFVARNYLLFQDLNRTQSVCEICCMQRQNILFFAHESFWIDFWSCVLNNWAC